MWEEIFKFIRLGERSPPKLLMLSPTDFCNLKCRICWRLKKNATFSQPSLTFLRKIIKEAGKLGVETIDLTGGGEPFLRKDIIKLMKLIKKYGMKGIMTTNFTLVKKYHIEEIVKMRWDELNISLDGSNPKINDYIRGEGTFNLIISNIKLITQVKKEKGKEKPIIRLSFVITRLNFNDIPNFIRLAKKLEVGAINFSVLFKWESNKEFWIKKKEEEKMKEILIYSLKLARKNNIRTNLGSILKFGVNEHKPPSFCFAPWYMLFINASKEAMACCTLASLYQNLLGKVKSLEEVWFGEKMEKFRERMKKRLFFKECKRCLPEFTQMFDRKYKEMMEWSFKKQQKD